MVTALAAALALAACSSSGGHTGPATSSAGGGSGGGGPASSAAQVSSGSPVQIMVTTSLSSPTFSLPQLLQGAQAAASSLNAQGGIDGHPIKIISCNDQENPNQAAQCAQQAVSDKVTAVTGFFLFGPQIFTATGKAGIPVLDEQPVSTQAGTAPNSYSITAGSYAEYLGIGHAIVKKGDTDVAIINITSAASALNATWAKTGITGAGGHVTKIVTATEGAPDYSTYVQQAMQGDPKAIDYVGTPEDFPKLVTAAKQAGYKGDIATVIGQVPPATAKAIAGSGLNVLVTSPFVVPPGSQATAFSADMTKYQPTAVVDVFSEGAWAAIHVIAKALKGSPAVDAAALTAALKKSTISVGPMMGTIDYTKPSPVPDAPRLFNPNIILMKVANGGYTAQGGFFSPFSG